MASKADVMPEIQASYIKNFLKKRVGEKTKFSQNFRKDFSQSLSIFLYYLSTMIKMKQANQNKKMTKQEIIERLYQLGFEEIAEDLETIEWKPKKKQAQIKKRQKEIVQDEEIEEKMDNINLNIQDQQQQQQKQQQQQNEISEDDQDDDDKEVQSEDEIQTEQQQQKEKAKKVQLQYEKDLYEEMKDKILLEPIFQEGDEDVELF